MITSTKEAVKYFGALAGLLELSGENHFKIRAYEKAISTLSADNIDIIKFQKLVREKKVPGFGAQLSAHLDELIENGSIKLLNTLRSEIPNGLQEMLKVKGLSGKKIKLIHETLSIKTLDELKLSCENREITKVKGFAEKSALSLLNNINYFISFRGMIRINTHEEMLNTILSKNSCALLPTKESIRKNEVFSEISLIGLSEEKEKIITLILNLDGSLIKEEESELSFFIDDIKLNISISKKETFEKDHFLLSCSEDHLKFLTSKDGYLTALDNFDTTKNFYEKIGLPSIPPELRDDHFEILVKDYPEFISPSFPLNDSLIKDSDLKGVIHVHSNYSDGLNSIEEMAASLKEQGFEYLGITDHSKSAGYAGGLSVERIKYQHEEIDRLNEKLAPFRILKGIESDILKDGSLDYPDSVLETFDFIVASIHARFSENKKDMTKRITEAVKNPYTSILGHPSGRLLLERPPYEFDLEEVLEVASQSKTAIEFNSNPKRLDLTWTDLIKVRKAGVPIVITPDAHTVAQVHFLKYGALLSKKAGLFPSNILNTLSADQFLLNFKR